MCNVGYFIYTREVHKLCGECVCLCVWVCNVFMCYCEGARHRAEERVVKVENMFLGS